MSNKILDSVLMRFKPPFDIVSTCHCCAENRVNSKSPKTGEFYFVIGCNILDISQKVQECERCDSSNIPMTGIVISVCAECLCKLDKDMVGA